MRTGGDEQGFTLIEMLAVLAIIGVTAGATVLGIGAATRGPSVEAEAQRLAARLQSVADEAMVSDRPLAFTWDDRGYCFVSWDGHDWQPGRDEGHARHELAIGIRMNMGRRRPPLMVGVDGSGVPAALGVRGDEESWSVVYDGLTVTALPASAS